jgi:hypothetical protein
MPAGQPPRRRRYSLCSWRHRERIDWGLNLAWLERVDLAETGGVFAAHVAFQHGGFGLA